MKQLRIKLDLEVDLPEDGSILNELYDLHRAFSDGRFRVTGIKTEQTVVFQIRRDSDQSGTGDESGVQITGSGVSEGRPEYTGRD